jgi:ankyrin repeat protein
MSKRLDTKMLGALALTMLLAAASPPESPVADAAMHGQVDRVRALLHEGADVNAAQGDGMTALHWAAERGNASLAEILVNAGAHVHVVTRVGDYTPLHLAAKSGAGDVIDVLVKAGAEVGARTSTGGASPLHFAAASGSVAAVSALLGAAQIRR